MIDAMKPEVWIKAGVIIIYGSNVDAIPHKHHAMQIIWPNNNSPCRLNENELSRVAVINSAVEHKLQMDEGWILLVEPKSVLGEQLSLQLKGESFKTFHPPIASDLPVKTTELISLLAPLFDQLALTNQLLIVNESIVVDKRILQLIDNLNQCLQGDCIKPSNWRAFQVAQQLALSESRFLHLFTEEMGIAWRPYLIWRRMMCAIQAMLHNASATEAAHLAGFSDSAHLSRTFKNTFGMTIRQANTVFRKG